MNLAYYRFPVSRVESIIKEVLSEVLEDQSYQAELTHQWTKLISDTVKTRVKELNLPRYKIMVCVWLLACSGEKLRRYKLLLGRREAKVYE